MESGFATPFERSEGWGVGVDFLVRVGWVRGSDGFGFVVVFSPVG